MKATELRIGNWVKTCTPDMEIMIPHVEAQVQGITIFQELEFNHTTRVEGFKMASQHVSGISITNQWLIDFGFKKGEEVRNVMSQWDEWRHERIVGKIHYDLQDKEYKHYFDHHRLSVPFNYVHQLQNLFLYLTGNELIKNK